MAVLFTGQVPFLLPNRHVITGSQERHKLYEEGTSYSLLQTIFAADVSFSHNDRMSQTDDTMMTVAFWSLSALEQLQGPHHQRHIRCLSGVWSGTTLRRASVQLSKPSDTTYSARPVGQPGRSRRLPQCGKLMIGEELLGYHNNNNNHDDNS